MIVLRFSPVSSGLFSFRMSNTRSAGQAHLCEQYADTDSWSTLSAACLAADTDCKHMAMCKKLQGTVQSTSTKSDLQLYTWSQGWPSMFCTTLQRNDSHEADVQVLWTTHDSTHHIATIG